MKLNTLKEASLKNNRVLLRLELNVPFANGKVADDTRIKAALPTIKYILKQKPKQLIIISHLGRPKGLWLNRLSLKTVAKLLEKKLKRKVTFFPRIITKTKTLPSDPIIFLENMRFYKEEEQNSSSFAKHLASFADIYINDAFGTLHRKHASVHAVTDYLPSYAGLLIEQEVKELSRLFNPTHPYIVVIGGGKADKLKTIQKMIKHANKILVGGVSANMILQARGYEIGKSNQDPALKPLAKKLSKLNKLVIPCDFVVAKNPRGRLKTVPLNQIPKDLMIVDIGPKTRKLYAKYLKVAKTIFWSGPLGYIEYPPTAKGTIFIARAIAASYAFSVVGGGDSDLAVKRARVEKKINHISTGGGASLSFVEDHQLVSLKKLMK